ncbi:hypothetical protein BH18ACT12_BH18ACT12_11320 [soil metagenome]
MGQGGYRLLLGVAATLAAAFCGPAAGATDCSTRLLSDWRDGRVDRTYPVACYREALAGLPEDLQVYSTAKSDLTRELQSRLDDPRRAGAAGVDADDGVSPVLVLAVTAGLLLAGGSLATIAR